jgi:hypothetical protein
MHLYRHICSVVVYSQYPSLNRVLSPQLIPAQLFYRSLVLPLTTLVNLSLPPLACVLFIRDISSGLIHPLPAAAPSLASILLAPPPPPSSARFIHVAVPSSPPFSAGSRRVVSVKGSATGVGCNSIGSCGSLPAGLTAFDQRSTASWTSPAANWTLKSS